MKKIYIILIILILVIIAIVSSIPFRPYHTHEIVRRVLCYSCHIDEARDLEAGKHINIMNDTQKRIFTDYIDIYGNSNNSDWYKTFMGACYSCHITYKNYNLFGLTDPYVFNNSDNHTVNAQYGEIFLWPWSSNETYFQNNVNITIELEVLSVYSPDSYVSTQIDTHFANYSGQQSGDIQCGCSATLYEGETQVIEITNVTPDYFNITLFLNGPWLNSTLNLRVKTDNIETDSFTIYAEYPPIVYNIPGDISSRTYIKGGAYKAVRLDYIWPNWINNSVNGTITSSENIQTNNTNGWINGTTCGAPDGMCHINQKATYMGLLALENNSDRSYYVHDSRYVTRTECMTCHLGTRNIYPDDDDGGGDGGGTPTPTPIPCVGYGYGCEEPTPTPTPCVGYGYGCGYGYGYEYSSDPTVYNQVLPIALMFLYMLVIWKKK